jgi:hypothetical protein
MYYDDQDYILIWLISIFNNRYYFTVTYILGRTVVYNRYITVDPAKPLSHKEVSYLGVS